MYRNNDYGPNIVIISEQEAERSLPQGRMQNKGYKSIIPDTGKRTEQVNLRMSKKMKAIISKKSNELGISLTDYLLESAWKYLTTNQSPKQQATNLIQNQKDLTKISMILDTLPRTAETEEAKRLLNTVAKREVERWLH